MLLRHLISLVGNGVAMFGFLIITSYQDVKAGNSIVYYHSVWEYRPGISYVNPPPLRVLYINKRGGSFGMFLMLVVFDC